MKWCYYKYERLSLVTL